jgi:hypothetical protein
MSYGGGNLGFLNQQKKNQTIKHLVEDYTGNSLAKLSFKFMGQWFHIIVLYAFSHNVIH